MTIVTGSNPGIQVLTTVDNETIIVAPGATVRNLVTHNSGTLFVNYGYIENTFGGVTVGVTFSTTGTGDFINKQDGIVVGDTAGVTIDLQGDVVNDGVILGKTTHGVSMQGGANNSSVVNSGDIYGALGGVIVSAGSAQNVAINNSGEIRGDLHGLWLLNALGAAPVVVNSGTIVGRTNSILALNGDRLNVTNSGALIGNVTATSTNQSDKLINNGTVTGNVSLGSGIDLYQGSGSVSGIVSGEDGNDDLVGGNLADRLNGGNNDDRLTGGLGNDTLDGGAGDDTYVVDSAADVLLDASGVDTVQATVTWTLGAAFEKLTLVSGDINGTGNGLANIITGSTGNNVLDGGAGADTLRGGLGNDTYVLSNGADIVQDAGGAADLVTTTITRSLLTAGLTTIENLTLLAGNINGTGNNLGNLITGSAGANTLTGGVGTDTLNGLAGNDVLIGGVGIDTLTGGANNDFFVFNAPLSAANRDIVTDFFAPQDTFRLENAVMPGLGAAGALNANLFFAGAAAHDANDRIVYNKTTGALFYDANGNAAAGVTLLATLTTKPTLTAADFAVI
jgi:Ca2+-binding RTX toxin-like protein